MHNFFVDIKNIQFLKTEIFELCRTRFFKKEKNGIFFKLFVARICFSFFKPKTVKNGRKSAKN